MIEINIKLTGDTLLNEKVDKLLQIARSIGCIEENIKPEQPKIKATEEIEPDEQKEQEEQEGLDDLKAEVKKLFIVLARENRPKAKELLESYNIPKFSELENVLKTKEDWLKVKNSL